MTKEVDYATGTVVTPEWLDAMQEVQSGLAWNFVIEASGTNKVRVVAGTGKDQVGIIVNGQIRYTTTTKETAVISGGAALYNIFATADTSDREFALVATTLAAPAAVANYRKVGEADWDGAAITAVRSMAGPAKTHGAVFTGTTTIQTPSAAAVGTEAVNAAWVRAFVASLNIYGPGDIKINPSATLPAGWLYCDGSAVSRTTYSALYAALGGAASPHGQGDGSTTFNLPDLRGRVVVGLDNMDNTVGTGGGSANRLANAGVTVALGGTGGTDAANIAVNELPVHTHDVSATASATSSGDHSHSLSGAGTSSNGDHAHVLLNGSGATMGAASVPTGAVQGGSTGATGNYIGQGNNTFRGDTNTTGAHTHTVSGSTTTNGAHTHGLTGVAGAITGHTGQTKLTRLQPFIQLNYIIKT